MGRPFGGELAVCHREFSFDVELSAREYNMTFSHVPFSSAVPLDRRGADHLRGIGRLAADKHVDFEGRACRRGPGADRVPGWPV
ncbi:hypothetical protein ES708_22557 [subsurface metagenome]